MILTEATNLRAGLTQAITAALRNSSFVSFWTYLTTTISTIISGSIGLIKYGTGTLVLTGSNTYNGTTTINSGVLNIQNNNALGSSGSGTVVANGAALYLDGGITVTGEALSLSGGGISATGTLRSISGNNTWTGNIVTSGSTQVRINSASGSLTITGNVNFSSTGAQSLNIAGPGNILISGNISSASIGGVLISTVGSASGILTLTGNNTFSGTLGANSGTVSISSIANSGSPSAAGTGNIAIGAPSGTGTIIYTGPAATSNKVITLGGGDSRTMTIIQNGTGLLTLTGALTSTVGTGIKTLALNGTGSGEITGVISATAGTLNVTKNGAGTWVLSGINTYTGTTSILAGVLRTSTLISGTTGKFSQCDFTNTTLTVTFSVAPVAGETYRLFPGATTQTYANISLIGAPNRTATYNSTNSTLTIA